MKIHSAPTLERAHSLILNHSGVVFKPDITTLIANRMQQHWIILDGLIPSMRWLLWGKLTDCISPRSTERSWMTGATKPARSVGGPGTMTMSVRRAARGSVCSATSAITIPPGSPYTWSTVPGKGRELNRWALAMKREEALWTLCEIQWNVNDFFFWLSKFRLWKKNPGKSVNQSCFHSMGIV